jgi:uncharacterized membrane protein YhaH (DUF805 family)
MLVIIIMWAYNSIKQMINKDILYNSSAEGISGEVLQILVFPFLFVVLNYIPVISFARKRRNKN